MENRRHTPILYFALVAALISGCRKESVNIPDQPQVKNTELRNGLPPSIDTIHGMFYAGFRLNRLNNQNNHSLVLSACFRDPPAGLLSTFHYYNEHILFPGIGNVSVGDVAFRNQMLNESQGGPTVSYNGNSFVISLNSVDAPVSWSTEGNKSFTPLKITVTRGFPKFLDTASAIIVSKSKGLALNVRNIFGNYDSVVVQVSDQWSFASHMKAIADPDSVIAFDSIDVAEMVPSNNHKVKVMAFNYSNITRENKNYVFILGSRIEKQIAVKP